MIVWSLAVANKKERKHLRPANKRKPIKGKPRRAANDHLVCTRNQQKMANNHFLVVDRLQKIKSSW